MRASRREEVRTLAVYYLAYNPPRDLLLRRRLVKELIEMGAHRLHFSLWRIPSTAVKDVLHLLRGQRPIMFKRARGVLPPHVAGGEGEFDLGTVNIIAYRLPRSQSCKRARLSRALWQTPALKIGRCLYLLPHLKTCKLLHYQGSIFFSAELSRLCEMEGIEMHQMAYLRVVYPMNHENVLQALTEAQEAKAERLLMACRWLADEIKTGSMQDIERFRKILSAHRSRYRGLKGIVLFLSRELGVDLYPSLKKVYASFKVCDALLETTSMQVLPK